MEGQGTEGGGRDDWERGLAKEAKDDRRSEWATEDTELRHRGHRDRMTEWKAEEVGEGRLSFNH